MKEQVKALAKHNLERVIAMRRHLHQYPELSFQEKKTAAWVANELRALDIEVQEGIAGTGVVGTIKGKNPDSKTIALRADMDALPIMELNEVPYKSLNPGVMHACGHDVHTSALLGVAAILQTLKNDWEGTVRLVFQPGEERLPGGASLMIKEGVLVNPIPAAMLGQHVMPQLETGKVGFRPGRYMASTDELYMTIIGKGGHAAMPEYFVDPVIISAHILVALQQIVSRYANPRIPSVLSFGKVIAEGATNVIPNEVRLEGTFRTMNEEWRATAHDRMYKIATAVAESMGAKCEFEIRRGYPVLENNPELTLQARQSAIDFLGADQVVDLDIWMAAEDFAYYTHHVPSCFYRLGTRNESKNIVSGVHTPTFDIDENALETGTGLMTWLTLQQLF